MLYGTLNQPLGMPLHRIFPENGSYREFLHLSNLQCPHFLCCLSNFDLLIRIEQKNGISEASGCYHGFVDPFGHDLYDLLQFRH